MARGRGRVSSPFSSFSLIYFYLIFFVASTFIAHKLFLHFNAQVESIQTLDFDNLSVSHGDSVLHSPEILGQDLEKVHEEFKIYMYPEEELDTTLTLGKNNDELMRIYAMEQYVIKKLRNSRVLTDNPEKADLFFVPISCQRVKFWNATQANAFARIENYFRSLIYNFPYWNRTSGRNHFYMTCHYDLALLNVGDTLSLAKKATQIIYSPSNMMSLMPRKDISLPKAPLHLASPPDEHELDYINALEINPVQDFDIEKIVHNVDFKYCIIEDDLLHECINNDSYAFVIFSSNTDNAIHSQLVKILNHTVRGNLFPL